MQELIMIHQPLVWRKDLKKMADTLSGRVTQHRWREPSYAAVEKAVMIGCHAIRKLVDTMAIPPRFGSRQIHVVCFPSKGRKVSVSGDWPRVTTYYDLTRPARRTITVKDFCNRLVHSRVFSLWFSPNGNFEGLFVASDREKEPIDRIPIATVIQLFNDVAISYAPETLRFGPYRNREFM